MNGAVLIVDDILTVRMDLADAFTSAGFRALPCATVAATRQALAHELVSLAVLDVVLPDGDGIDLLQEIRRAEATARIPILMLSSEADVKDRIRGLQTGADDYVGKPYDTGYVLARARELLREHDAAATAAPTAAEPATILIIDDSLTFREELRQALQQAGYAVQSAASGEEGLRLAAARRPSAIVVDGEMPGIDGSTVVRRLRLDAALRGTPCLLLTASDDRGAELRALDAGADGFVRKEEDLAVILARVAAVLRRPSTERVDADSLLGPKRILAVDDSVTYLQELAATLRVEGYDVVLARSGEEALEMLAAQPVDCILLDLMMPGLSGQDTCRRIKASPAAREIPLIMITALENRAAMIDGLGAGADDYIPKTSEFAVLKARLRAQLRRKQFEDEHRKIREELLRSELDAAEARAARQVAETRAALTEELQRKNEELEAFSYSVSHDLRAPLRAIAGFGQALEEDSEGRLDETSKDHLRRIRTAAKRMNELIDALLQLSRAGRAAVTRAPLNLSELAAQVAEELQRKEPDRPVQLVVQPGMTVIADSHLLRAVLENLLGNAWKFTSKTAAPRIEVGSRTDGGRTVYFVRDNGGGFDMSKAARMFTPFQRLHSDADFPGTGIGLATVRRIVDRHGGTISAVGALGEGATISFTLAPHT
ncbi:MAG TPA: response regulator [Polyangia bacterium]|nr:response regulator [Polyangia bacterium]